MFLSLVWILSLLPVFALWAYHALLAHQSATHNRLDNINYVGPLGVILFVWGCYVTQAIASAFALCLTVFRDATPLSKLHAWLVASAGWFLIYSFYRPGWTH